MRLIIGGRAQGKLHFVQTTYGLSDEVCVFPLVWNEYQDWFHEMLAQGKNPEEDTREQIANNPDCYIISDEVGNGIVPVEAAEREYRERLGRMLCELAAQAESVERVICGIGQKLK